MSGFKLGTRSLERAKGVNPLLLDCAMKALAISKYDMTVPWMGGVRTAEEQNGLFKEGNSKADGFDKISYHQTGNALDIIPVDGGYENTRGFNHFAKCMYESWQQKIYEGTAKGILHWGGLFGKDGWDKPHWEIK